MTASPPVPRRPPVAPTVACALRPRPVVWLLTLLVILLTTTISTADAAVAYRSKTCSLVEDVSSITLARPAGTTAGDLLLATVGSATTSTASAPSGWTQVPGLRGTVEGTHQLVTWYKVAGSSEPGSYVFSTGGTSDATGGSLTAFTGVDAASPIAGTPGQTIHTALASTFTLPSSSSARAGSMRVSSIAHDDVGDSTYSGGMTELCDNNTTNGADLSFSAAYEATGAGTTATRTVTLTDNGHAVTHTVVLNPAVAPTVDALSPSAGPTAGGTMITITGSDFTGATGVTIGGVPATGVTVVNDSTITATVPAGAPGTVNVRVTSPDGTSPDAGTADDYTYFAAPTVTALSPTSGPSTGGTTVTITGTNFASLTGAAAVRFGSTSASAYTVVNATTITATAPAGTGTQSVRVTTPGGTSADTSADDYTYVAAPTVTALSPTQGPAAGGTTVTITGTNLTGATLVRFGATDASSFLVVNATTITATAPAGAGTQDVRVTTSGGTSANTSADNYTYVAAPAITALSPTQGPAAGGTTVTITGTNLTGATAVVFGATAATGFTVVNATTITATAPAGTGTRDVRVTTPGGISPNTAADDFTYVPAPTVTALSPTQGPTAGGTTVTITGTNLTGATAVVFGATAASGFTVLNATTITATAPAGTGTRDVRITTPGGTSADTASDDYTYLAIPAVTAISPTSGPTAGGGTVTITGGGFTGATQVRFGAIDAVSFTVVSATTMTATVPAQAAGVVAVRVTGPGGQSADTAADDYTYVAAPVITSISPTQGPEAGGTTVTITGTALSGASSVVFGATSALGFTVVNATTITATAPAHAAGTLDVRVTTAAGITANTPADDFTYLAACSAGGLTATPSDLTFTPFALDGFDKTRTTTAKVAVSDMTGAGAGWKLEVGTEQFTAGAGKVLPLDAAQITDANATPLGGNCSAPTRALSTYPVPLPISPSKARVYGADVGTGKGPVDVTLDVALHVPGNVRTGTYASTWTYDLTAAP